MLSLAYSLAAAIAVPSPCAPSHSPTVPAEPPAKPPRTRIDRPNIFTASAVFELPNPGLALGYERIFHRAFGMRADIEHLPSPPGFRHLPGLSSSIGVTAWPLQTGQGPYLLAGGGVATNFWYRRPSIARITGFVDFAGGYRFVFKSGFLLGVSAGLRYGFNGNREVRLCTHRDVCRNARTGAFARLMVEVGWRFGRRSQPA